MALAEDVTMTDHRQYQRIHFVTATEILIADVSYHATLADISLKGALVVLPDVVPLEKGVPCSLRMQLGVSEVVLSFNGEVAHAHDTVVGIKFTRFSLESITHLRRLLELNSADPDRVLSELHAFVATE